MQVSALFPSLQLSVYALLSSCAPLQKKKKERSLFTFWCLSCAPESFASIWLPTFLNPAFSCLPCFSIVFWKHKFVSVFRGVVFVLTRTARQAEQRTYTIKKRKGVHAFYVKELSFNALTSVTWFSFVFFLFLFLLLFFCLHTNSQARKKPYISLRSSVPRCLWSRKKKEKWKISGFFVCLFAFGTSTPARLVCCRCCCLPIPLFLKRKQICCHKLKRKKKKRERDKKLSRGTICFFFPVTPSYYWYLP